MKVIVFVKASKDTEAGVMPKTDELAEMGKFNEELVKAGVMLAGEGLHPSKHGKRVRFDARNKATVVDGPFAEAKELVAGFTMIKVNSREEALEWARRWPVEDADGQAYLEVRQVYELDDFGDAFTPELRDQHARSSELAAKNAVT